MNQYPSTSESLLDVGQRLFAKRGYDASSVRDITSAAGVNLGAVTYHFGSKDALYQAVLERALVPLRETIAATAHLTGPALDRVEAVLRAMFAYLGDHPELPRLIVQQLAAGTELPPVIAATMQANIGVMTGLIQEGQRDGTIRKGDPQLLALSFGGQPIFLALIGHALKQAVGLDPTDPAARKALVDSLVTLVRAGLQSTKEDPS